MIRKPFQDITLSRLGMGNMRLPLTDPKDQKSPIDRAAAEKVIDAAYAAGINYFDTAYVYNDGDSEKTVGEVMKKYPRDSFYIATKFPINATSDYKGVFEEQLRRLQTDHIDFYLLHCLLDTNIDKYLDSGCIDYFLEMKKQGKIRYFGFSSHASPAVLKRFADHHQWDFAQLMINYYDWNFETAKEEYEVLEQHNIPIMVMEPVRGGRLASLTPDSEALLKAAHPEWSLSSWAMRFVKSLPQVQVVLSGMNEISQVEDNAATFSDPYVFTDADRDTLFEAVRLFRSSIYVPCTACRYCCSSCPAQINIPEYMKVLNAYKVDGAWTLERAKKVVSDGHPADCIGCETCLSQCPQKINVTEKIQELAGILDKNGVVL